MTIQAKYLSVISLYYSTFSTYSHLQTKHMTFVTQNRVGRDILYFYYHLK